MKILTLLILIFCSMAVSQTYTIKGKIVEAEKHSSLSFANIRFANSTIGTAANKEGEYEIKLPAGVHKLIASFIGYVSDTIKVELKSDKNNVDFSLRTTSLNLPPITITPGINPALEIIQKAIEKKNKRNDKLISYKFEAYTKGLIRTEEEINTKTSNSISLGISDNDTSELMITGILENQSTGYFEKPDNYKEIITARRQSSNFPPSINILTGGRVLQNFYENNVNFFGKNLPGPLADNSLSYYYYFIENTVAQNNRKIYQIHMEPDNSSDPGFVGSIFITDETFDLVKVELNLNRAANTGGIFDTINIFQQFGRYSDSIYMPVDYRLFVTANVLSLVKFGFELNTILYDYKINNKISGNIFNKAVVTVLPEADEKDSTFWESVQTIPNTNEEVAAYARIDSISRQPVTFWDRFSFLSSRINLSDNFYISGPLSIYYFNSVEGNALDFSFGYNNAFDNRFYSDVDLSYGFADKKFKKIFSAECLFGDYRTYSFSINAFDKINILFGDSDKYVDFTATILALVSKYKFRDYFYSKGFEIAGSGELFPVLELSAGFKNQTDNSAENNSDFSIFNKGKKYRENSRIFETKINSIFFGFNFDFRNYIEDGTFRRRINPDGSFILFGGKVTISDKNILKSNLNFTLYEADIKAAVKVLSFSSLRFKIYGMYNSGSLPYQNLYALPGNIDAISQYNTFRTLEFSQYFGDRLITFHSEQLWGNELFRLARIPLLKDIDLQFVTFLNAAYSSISGQSQDILFKHVDFFEKPFYEAGFGIGHILIPLRLEFAWKLNHRGNNNFRVSLNSVLF